MVSSRAMYPSNPEPFSVEVAGSRVVFRGELDMASAPAAERAIAECWAATGAAELDLSELEFLDSSGLHVLIEARNAASGNEHTFVVVELSEQAREVMELTDTLDWLTGDEE